MSSTKVETECNKNIECFSNKLSLVLKLKLLENWDLHKCLTWTAVVFIAIILSHHALNVVHVLAIATFFLFSPMQLLDS